MWKTLDEMQAYRQECIILAMGAFYKDSKWKLPDQKTIQEHTNSLRYKK
jgi:hypothetical protein